MASVSVEPEAFAVTTNGATPEAGETVSAAIGGAPGNAVVVISTSLGDVTVELFNDKAPVSVANFLPLVEFLRALRRPTGSDIQPRDNSDADRHFGCPMCGKTMTGHPYGGPGNVNIDTCEPCSVIWLDRNELQRIVMAPDYSSLYSR